MWPIRGGWMAIAPVRWTDLDRWGERIPGCAGDFWLCNVLNLRVNQGTLINFDRRRSRPTQALILVWTVSTKAEPSSALLPQGRRWLKVAALVEGVG